MFKYRLILIMAVLLHCSAFAIAAASSLKGMVKDGEGRPLPGAVIEIPDLKTGTVADSTGYYVLDNVPAGKYVVVVSVISFAKAIATVTIAGETVYNFMLMESAIEHHEVVITGQSKATEIRRSPVPVVAVNSQYLKTNIGTNIIDALKDVPGVSTVTTGPNVSKPFIRGLGYNRVLTLYDGMRPGGPAVGR